MQKIELENGEMIDFPDVYEFDETGMIYNGGNFIYTKGKRGWTCPVCGKHTLENPGQDEDCPICGWIDETCDLNHPDFALGENGVSYNQAKEIWGKYHDNIHNHKDEFKLTFGVPELDEWIKENAGKITENDLTEKVKEHFGENPEEQKDND